jgi:MFS family permease
MIVALAQLLRRDPAQKGQKPYGTGSEDMLETVSGTASFSTREAVRTRPYWIIAVMLFLVGYCVTGTNLHVVPFATDLKIPEASAANVLSIVGITGILGGVGLGRFGDRFGNRNAYIIGFSIMMVSLIWLTIAGNLWQLYVFAPVFGFALQGCLSLQTPLVAELFGLESIGVILGSLSLVYNIGSAAGSFFTGYLRDVTGDYMVSFITCSVLCGIALISMIILRPVRKLAGRGLETLGELPLS